MPEVDPAHGRADDGYLALDADSGSNRQSSWANDKKDSTPIKAQPYYNQFPTAYLPPIVSSG